MPGATGDCVSEAGIDADIGPFELGIGDEVDPRPVDDGVSMCPGERQGAVGKLGGERPAHVAEVGQVIRVDMDDVAVRDEGAIGRREAFALHRPLDPSLQLDGLQTRPEEACRGALKQAFEEPLDGGEWRHGRSRSLPEGPEKPVRARSTLTIAAPTGVPTVEGRQIPCVILSTGSGGSAVRTSSARYPGTR